MKLWKAVQWHDHGGNPTESWDIYCEEERIADDWTEEDAKNIAARHNIDIIAMQNEIEDIKKEILKNYMRKSECE